MQVNAPRLMIVDDNREFVDVLETAAKQHGFDVRTAANGRIAMRVCEEFRPESIVLDVVMPEADGVEFINWHAASGQSAKLVVVTGFNPLYANLAATIAKAKGTMSVTVLNKPVRLKALFEAIEAPAKPPN